MLVKIQTNDQGEQLVSARELHKFLGVKTPFTTWIRRRLLKYKFAQENINYTVISSASQSCEAKKRGTK